MEMGFAKICRASSLKMKHGNVVNEEEQLGLGFVRYNRGLGRKRIGVFNKMEDYFPLNSANKVPLLKRQCSERRMVMMMMVDDDDDNYHHEKSALESLPQDVLIRIICGVEHEDLKQLFNVSKSIREATIIAKQSHFAYSTPRKVKAFRTSIDFQELDELDDIEAPNAPRQGRQWRYNKKINRKKLADISVALFV